MWVELPPPCCGFAFPGLCPWSCLTSSSLPLKAPRMARLSGRWSRQKEGEGAGPSGASSIEAKAWTEQLQDQLGANRIYNFPTLRNLSFLSLSHSLNCSSSGVPVSAKDTILHLSQVLHLPGSSPTSLCLALVMSGLSGLALLCGLSLGDMCVCLFSLFHAPSSFTPLLPLPIHFLIQSVLVGQRFADTDWLWTEATLTVATTPRFSWTIPMPFIPFCCHSLELE